MECHLPPYLWAVIKCMAFTPQQWVNMLAEKKETVYAKAFMELKGDAVLNLCYDTPMKRKWLRLWLQNHGQQSLPASGQHILDSYAFNADAVINWWQVVWEGQVWKEPDPTTMALEDQDPLHAPMLESALTSDRAKAEAWVSVCWATGRSLLSLYSHHDIQHALQNLLTQTQPGREWEYWIVQKVCLGPSPDAYHANIFEQLMSQILAYFLIQNYVEAVQIFVESKIISSALSKACLYTHAHKTWVRGIMDGLFYPMVDCGDDDNDDGSDDDSDDDMMVVDSDDDGNQGQQDAWMHQVVV